jgi:uridylate kinase
MDKLNARAEIFTAQYVQGVGKPFTPKDTKSALDAGKIAILAGGTGNPFFTTDTAAVLRALEIHANIVLKGTKVDGVYDKDPEKYPDAQLIKSLSYDEYIKRDLRVMDLTAISLAKDHNLPIKIFNIKAPQNIHKAVYQKDFGSIIK